MNNSRRNFIQLTTAMATTAIISPSLAFASEKTSMDTIEALMTRRSVRAYTNQPITDEQVNVILKAAMQAPSAYNEQPWEFIVVRDKQTLTNISNINKYARMAKNAPLGILTCVNISLIKHQQGYGVIDVSNATMSILLAAHAMGIGTVWTGVHPNEELVPPFRKEFNLPENIIPLAFVLLGYPKTKPQQKDHFKPERIKQEKWK